MQASLLPWNSINYPNAPATFQNYALLMSFEHSCRRRPHYTYAASLLLFLKFHGQIRFVAPHYPRYEKETTSRKSAGLLDKCSLLCSNLGQFTSSNEVQYKWSLCRGKLNFLLKLHITSWGILGATYNTMIMQIAYYIEIITMMDFVPIKWFMHF